MIPTGEHTGNGIISIPRESLKKGESKKREAWYITEKLVEVMLFASAFIGVLTVFMIFIFLFKEAVPLLLNDASLATLGMKNWYPISDPPTFGLLPLIAGSVIVTAGAIVISVPLGVGAAIYLSMVAGPTVREILKPTIEVLAGIPSVVLGFFGLAVLAPEIKSLFDIPTGLTALTGALTLALMALPTIASISEDAISAVPGRYMEAALSMGSTRWQAIVTVIVPAALSGITASIMLGIGRAIGETMTVLMVTGNAGLLPDSMLVPVRTMTATIAAEMGEVARGSQHYHALFIVGAVLFAMTLAINLIADFIRHRMKEVE
ncbi:phosphate ABC transporter permease subunit PstC [Heliophilum fasciatum]|uniref:Phosphate transport system permease protein n=1 Tax=Heliophilum fasciatum TaxID=35700 RepID=A0A4R2REZ1_9FIRM|nr:phosphate ABC transporter permease subunit PstC [Heliophilum fasciatum]MCW2278876.1 phosphate transport system permease protein [Heliophilum fasciatum]TCP62112.1 phosphate ABC transporter membrane protein 1 (PhoT family) [Heliophilum fasciatum]